jgi:hypothetical protein
MNTKKSIVMTMAAGSALLVGLPFQQAQAAPSSTAQSIMVVCSATDLSIDHLDGGVAYSAYF